MVVRGPGLNEVMSGRTASSPPGIDGNTERPPRRSAKHGLAHDLGCMPKVSVLYAESIGFVLSYR